MKTIIEHITDWCNENEITFSQTEDRILFSVTAEGEAFSMACLTMEEERVFVCLCGYGLAVPQAKRDAIASEILALNYTLKWGAFQLDATNGELTFRSSQLIPTDDAQARAMVEKTTTFTAQMFVLTRDTVKGWLL